MLSRDYRGVKLEIVTIKIIITGEIGALSILQQFACFAKTLKSSIGRKSR